MDDENEALRLKTLAEQNYTSSPSNLISALNYATKAHSLSPSLDGLPEMLTAFQILSAAAATSPPDWYKILQISPFSHINIIKKQYRKLALTLHPDKNPFSACEEAFKHVAEGFRVLSDRIKRKEYDNNLRNAMQAAALCGGGGDDVAVECSACRVRHRFDRKYLGQNLVCPSCKNSFRAVEVDDDVQENDIINNNDSVEEDVSEPRSSARIRAVEVDGIEENDIINNNDDNNDSVEKDVIGSRSSARIRAKGGGFKWRMSSIGEVLEKTMPENGELGSDNGVPKSKKVMGNKISDKTKSRNAEIGEDITLAEVFERSIHENGELGSKNKVLRSERGLGTRDSDGSKSKGVEIEDKDITFIDVLMRSIPENRNLGSNNKVLRSKRGLGTRDSNGSKSKELEIEDDDTTLVEVLERSIPKNGKLDSNNKVLRSKRGLGTRDSDGSKSKGVEIEDEDITLLEVLEKSRPEKGKLGSKNKVMRSKRGVSDRSKSKRVETEDESDTSMPSNDEVGSGDRVLRSRRRESTSFSNESNFEMGEIREDGITLAEMQMRAKKKVREEKMRLRVRERHDEGEKREGICKDKKRRRVSEKEISELMTVEDLDFYDFDKDKVGRSFKKGQIWAVYDDDDGMPRRYGLIDEASVYPFKIKLSFLEFSGNADEMLSSYAKNGFRISCGRFKVAKTELIKSVNIFSHLMDVERAAREIYRIYPKKGSVWAILKENASENSDKICYDIVVFLTSYDEIYGLSMAYLEKVEGFKTVFERREIGCHAIKWLKKADFRLFSHQIPARKLCGEKAMDLERDCWELDPASLPSEMLRIC